jgi:uncharacterized protein involved in outer membrane biogenesis
MANWRKTVLWVSGGLGIALIAGSFALPALIDSERLKALARDKAQTVWARDLAIGDLSLQLRPFPALHIKNVALANPAWAHSKNLLQAAAITAHLELLPLLTGKVSITRLSIDGLKANLEISKDGARSWDLQRAGQPETASGSAGLDLQNLRAAEVRNADISYQTGKETAQQWHIDDASVKADSGWREVRIDARLSRNEHPMQLQAAFADLSKIGVKGAVSEGNIDVRWGAARLAVNGRIPLEASLQNHALKADFSAESLTDMLGFFGIASQPTAAIKAVADLRDVQGKIAAGNLKISLGKLNITGNARIALSGPKPVINAHLTADRIDWVQTLKDAGRPAVPPKPPGELFYTHPLAWQALAAMQAIGGTLDAQVQSLRLRSGLELKNAKAHMIFDGDQLNMTAFSANLLGGSASGSMQFDGSKQSARINFDATDLLLGQWFSERGKQVAFSGGPMKIKASVSASGASMKALAASMTGPVTISMGRAVIASKKAGEAEALLTGLLPMLSEKDADRVDLACAGARLPFVAGRANAEPIVGARSSASQLLTSGFIDLRQQTLDLRGRVKAASGVSLGLSTLTGDVKIAGKINHPEVSLDPAGTPGALARLGAAVVTGGVSILGIAIWDAANSGADPCQIALAGESAKPGGAGKANKSKKPARSKP